MTTPNNGLPLAPENTIDPAAGLNLSLMHIDVLLQLAVVSVGTNTPPASPANGARYIIGTAPTGAWAGRANQLARWLDGGWQFFATACVALNLADGALWVRGSAGTWAAVGGGSGGMANPMTAPGDLIRGGTDGTPTRLAAGTNGQFLTLVSGLPAWGALPAQSPSPVVTESGTARTAALGDAGAYVRFTNAASTAYTVPPQSAVAWGAGAAIEIRRAGAGNLTLTPGAGVTLNAPSGGTLVLADRMSVMLKRVAADVWDVVGQTVAA